MPSLRLAFVATMLFVPAIGFAHSAPATSVRATIEGVSNDASLLAVRTRAGEKRSVRLDPKTRVILVVPDSLSNVKPGEFVGVAAVPGEGGDLKAMEVHVFPESMRGTGEGFRKYDLGPTSTMTNGNVEARVNGVDGPKLTVTYRGGQQTIDVGPKTPIVAFAPGARDDLKPGAAIIARGSRQDNGSVEASVVFVGKDGIVPPM